MTTPPEHVRYCIMVNGDRFPVETYERDPYGSGALIAHHRAAALSRGNGDGAVLVRLYVGERFLATYLRGRFVEPPSGNGDRPALRAAT